MNGTIEWAALDLMVELYGVTDVETFINELIAVRNHANRMAEAENG